MRACRRCALRTAGSTRTSVFRFHTGAAAGGGSGGVEVTPNATPGIKTSKDHPYLTQNARYMPGFSFPAPRKLSQIVKYSLLAREPPEKMAEIWKEFHAKRSDSVAMVLDRAQFDGFMSRSRKNPFFVYPVLKGDGQFFTLISQFQDNYCIFTYLEDYKKDPSNAEPYLSVTFFDDFLDKKGIVLVRGDFSGHLTKEDAKKLVRIMSFFYLKDPKPIETFNQEPARFDFQAYLAQIESMEGP